MRQFLRHLTSFKLTSLAACFLLPALGLYGASNLEGKKTISPPNDYQLVYMDHVGVTESNGVLTKTGTTGGFNAGANASNVLSPNDNGYMEFKITTERTMIFGYVDITAVFSNATFANSIYITSTGVIRSQEGATFVDYGNVVSGDVFRISREGNNFVYYKNGVAFRTVATDPTKELYPRVLISQTNAKSPIVITNKPQKFFVTANVTGTSGDTSDGKIDVTVKGARLPVSLHWNSGETTASIASKARGKYTLTITDADGIHGDWSYSIRYALKFIDLVGVTEVSARLSKPGGLLGWDTGSSTSNILDANTNGCIEFIAESTLSNTTSVVGFGLNTDNFLTSQFVGGIRVGSGNIVYAYEGVTATTIGTCKIGDSLKIFRKDAEIKYAINGVVVRTVSTDPTWRLQAKVDVYGGQTPLFNASFPGRIIVGAKVIGTTGVDGTGSIELTPRGGAAPYTYTWQNGAGPTNKIQNKARGKYTVNVTDAQGRSTQQTYEIGFRQNYILNTNVTESEGTLTKTSGAGWNAGAVSENTLFFGNDGWIEFVAGPRTDYVIGFANDRSNVVTGGFQKGLELSYTNNTIYTFENGTKTTLGRWIEGDVFRICRAGSQIKYTLNGSAIRTITETAIVDYQLKVIINAGANTPAVSTSFDQFPEIAATVAATQAPDGLGSILLTPKYGASSSYTYQWSIPGESTNQIVNKPQDIYSVTVTDAEGRQQSRTYSLLYKTSWNVISGVTETNGILTKSGATGWGGAVSTNVINAGFDGYVEFVATEGAGNIYSIGLSNNFASVGYSTMSNALRLEDDIRSVYAHEGGNTTLIGGWRPGDVFRISREGAQIKYYKNNVVIRTVASGISNAAVKAKALVYTGSAPLIISSFNDPASPGIVPDDVEYQVLKDLYNNLGGTAWYQKTNWPSTWPATAVNATFGTWFGVKVINGDIQELTFPDNNLVGVIPSSINNLAKLKKINFSLNKISGNFPTLTLSGLQQIQLNTNQITGLDLSQVQNKSAIALSLERNALDFADLEPLFTGPNTTTFQSITYSPQVFVSASQSVVWEIGSVPTPLSVSLSGSFNQYQWQKLDDHAQWVNIPGSTQSTYAKSPVVDLDKGFYRVIVTNQKATQLTLISGVIQVQTQTNVNGGGSLTLVGIPDALKLTRDGQKIADPGKTTIGLDELQEGTLYNVISRPPCLEGNYYIAFELKDEIGATSPISSFWDVQLIVELLQDGVSKWSQPMAIKNGKQQTLVSTIFHDQPISCNGNYQYRIVRKGISGDVPQSEIKLKIHFYHIEDKAFDPSEIVNLCVRDQTQQYNDGDACQCISMAPAKAMITWNTAAKSIQEFDLEWVFYEKNETSPSSLVDIFTVKEPVRVTTKDFALKTEVFYPDGKIWYRIRAVGSDPQYPGHRINGDWSYLSCNTKFLTVSNPHNEKNWQLQTVYAEEGKHKKVISYFDGTLRQRQAITNLNDNDVTNTLVAETMYDFEGRKSVDIMSAPSTDGNLIYKPAFNKFAGEGASVIKKSLYDNGSMENGVLSQAVGAGKYYSPANNNPGIHRSYIPDAEGYAYTQTEYLRDGTGRPKKQSGVGKEFRIDGAHATKYFYGNANQDELTRMFGPNVGVASHYKKNLVVDANGQVSVSYLDQEDRVIATALAGDKPSNVEALESYSSLPLTLSTVDLTSANDKSKGVSTITQRILNTSPQTYTIKYDLSAIADQSDDWGCNTCKYDLSISFTDPDGHLLDDLGTVLLNQTAVANPVNPFVIKDIEAACGVGSASKSIQFDVMFAEIGDYTITKTVVPHDMTFEEMSAVVKQSSSYQQRVDEIESLYEVNAVAAGLECTVCTDEPSTTAECPDAEQVIDDAINDVAEQDCENILRRIMNDLGIEEPLDDAKWSDIRNHPLGCQYDFCVKDKASDIFDMQIARIGNFSSAVALNKTNLLADDPFFSGELSGAGTDAHDAMVAALQNIVLPPLNYDGSNHIFSGTLAEVTDPANPNMIVHETDGGEADGKHVLYIDLMKKQATMPADEYNAALDERHWILYRSFYIEAKRQIKLRADVYGGCEPLRNSLAVQDGMNDNQTTDDMNDWASNHLYDGQTEPYDFNKVTDEDVDAVYTSIQFACMENISDTDKDYIKSRIESYLNARALQFAADNEVHLASLYKVISKDDWDSGTNSDLNDIQTKLSTYHCSLDDVSVDDHLLCLDEVSVQLPYQDLPPIDEGFSSESLVAPDSNSEQASQEIASPQGSSQSITSESVIPSSGSNTSFTSGGAYSLLSVEGDGIFLDEFNALVDLYESTRPIINGVQSNWLWHTNWTTDRTPVSVKNWYGVTVDEAGHVTELVLTSNGLKGFLPASIGNLTHLQRLDLSFNLIGKSIPGTIGSLLNLKELNLYDNAFTDQVPSELTLCTSLQTLKLFGNNFSSTEQNPVLPENIGDLINLTYFDFGDNPNTKILPASLCDLANLETLFLANCGIENLPVEFGKNFGKLTKLNLSGNQLGKPMGSKLTEYFHGETTQGQAMKSLTWLALSDNSLTALPENFGQNWTSLQTLILYKNKITQLSNYFRGDVNGDTGMSGLQYLYISNSYLLGTINFPGIFSNPLIRLPDNFGQNWTSLLELDLSYTALTSLTEYFHGFNGVGHGMDNLVKLYFTRPSKNPPGVTVLPANFGQNWVKVSEIYLSNHGFSNLPANFHNTGNVGEGMQSLTKLDLSGNNLSDLDDLFGMGLTKLTDLTLVGNLLATPEIGSPLSNYFCDTYDDGTKGMVALKNLSLSANRLTQLPASFGRGLQALTYLYLQGNQLTSLPDNFHGNTNGMPNIFVLQIGVDVDRLKDPADWKSNHIEYLPEHFGQNLKKLTSLHLENMDLKTLEQTDYFMVSNDGTNGMNSLRDLYLHCNQISKLPPNFGKNLTTLRTLFLYRNKLQDLPDHFHGADPVLGHGMDNLQSLWLSNYDPSYNQSYDAVYGKTEINVPSYDVKNTNQLLGLPNNFGKYLSKLITLYLEGNQLSHLTPYFNGNTDGMKSLQTLRLHNNNLLDLPGNFGQNWTSLYYLYLYGNQLQSLSEYFHGAITSGSGMDNLRYLYLGNKYQREDGSVEVDFGGNLLTSLPANFGQNWLSLSQLHLEGNEITDLSILHDNAANNGMPLLNSLFVQHNNLSSLPTDFGANFGNLTALNLSNNKLNVFSFATGALSKLKILEIFSNQIQSFPVEVWQLPSLLHLNIGDNLLDDRIDPNIPAKLTYFNTDLNSLTFLDVLEVKKRFAAQAFKYPPSNFWCFKQHLVDEVKNYVLSVGQTLQLSAQVDRDVQRLLGPGFHDCRYKWYYITPDGITMQLAPGSPFSATAHTPPAFAVTEEMDGYRYYYLIISDDVSTLGLRSNIQTLHISAATNTTLCIGFNPDSEFSQTWSYPIDDFIAALQQKCEDNVKAEKEILVQTAIDEYIETEVTNFNSKYYTNCLNNLTESLKYTYKPTEYHYTLYYYDQAGNLVQTVPPKGFRPFEIGMTTEQHVLVTKYEYNTLNQLVRQTTPDAGESRFFYNSKGQLRLSRNAKQTAEGHYSYSKYDEQGRVVEVGEMSAQNTVEARVEEANFPEAAEFVLTDITRTHYDLPTANELPTDFTQNNLRTRVAWVEVEEKDRLGSVATYYDYDVHGNVRSALQKIPGLDFKRTDYAYDLISGKVNYAIYQYGMDDQFIHQYKYDADNRLTDVSTSVDGFIWDNDASYMYYVHGPLARVELGEYNVQGQDYYYTLQGWIKGVNMPFGDDLLSDGSTSSLFGRDVFAYSLGYYQGDYKAIDVSKKISDTRDNLWARYNEVYANTGLYNGNISWMVTDLSDFGKAEADRADGMQGMVYRYDQLHRIMLSKSLKHYDKATGFAARQGDGAYDENYTYDPNGNILTLLRRDNKAAIKHNWQYSYYDNTNQLKKVKPEATVTYEYDQIGNLIADHDEGATILWTPYGKIHEVQKTDGSKVKYRYDAMGNRIEKKVEKAGVTVTNNYIRDASGNVMAVYKDTKAIEHNIYGTSRLGVYTGGRKVGELTLGEKTYELSNHLGNVLAVITDNVNRTAEGPKATVVRVNDYYPFGLDMPDRTSVAKTEINDTEQTPPASGLDGSDPGVVAYYALNGNTKDASCKNADGLVTGATTTMDNNGSANSAYHFTDDQYIQIPNTRESLSFIQNTHSFTIAAYVKLDDLTARSTIFATLNTTAGKGFMFEYENYDATYGIHQLRFSTSNGTTTGVLAKGNQYTVNDNGWHHVAVVGDGTKIRFFVDGVQDGTTTSVAHQSTGTSSENAMIGATPVLGGGYANTNEMHGAIDELFVFNRPLTPDEIRNLAQRKPLVETPVDDGEVSFAPVAYRYGFNGKEKDDFAGASNDAASPCVTCGELSAKLDSYVIQNGEQALLDLAQTTAYLNTAFGKTYTQQQYQQAIAECKLTNNYLNFAGVSYINLGDQPQFKMGTHDFTIEAWVKYAPLDGANYPIITNQKSGSPNFTGMTLLISNGKLRFELGDGSGYNAIESGSMPEANAWHHVAVQRIGNNASNYKMFIDGVEVTKTVVNQGLTDGDIDIDGINALNVGLRALDNAAFKGAIRELRWYERPLSASEISSSYNSGCSASPNDKSQLVLWLPMNEGAGTTVTDHSWYGLTSTLSGASLTWKGALATGKCVETDLAVLCAEGVESLTVYDYGFRIYNPAIAKFLSVDPLTGDYPWYTPYQFAGNKPIWAIDLDGQEEKCATILLFRGGAFNEVLKPAAASQLAEWVKNPGTMNRPTYGQQYQQDQFGNTMVYGIPVPRVVINPMGPPATEEQYENANPETIHSPGTAATYLSYASYQKEYTNQKIVYDVQKIQLETIPTNVNIGLAETDAHQERRSGGVFYLGMANDEHMFWGLQQDGGEISWYHINYSSPSSQSEGMTLNAYPIGKALLGSTLGRGTLNIYGVGINTLAYLSMNAEVAKLSSEGSKPANWINWSCAVGASRVMQSGALPLTLFGNGKFPQPTGIKGEFPKALMNWFKSSSKTFKAY